MAPRAMPGTGRARRVGEESPAFEQTYRRYLSRLASIDLSSRSRVLGISVVDDEAVIPLFGIPYRVSASGVRDPSGSRPIHSVSIVLCQHLLLCPGAAPPGSDWVSFKDFKDAAPFVEGFVNNAERAVARNFAGRVEDLKEASGKLGGADPGLEVSYDLSVRLDALPRVPVVLLFNDEDEEFPADATILFERGAESYLDVECLAIIGWLLADHLAGAAGGADRTIM